MDFKSYKGHHTLLFGDSYFTSIIGPNGSGKSNSMDAISFVLGIKSSHLRSSHLRDLIYRGRVLKTSKINADGSAEDALAPANGEAGSDDEQSTQTSTQRNDPHSAWVMAVYEDAAGDEVTWKRTITSQGQSEYRINNRVVNAKQYNDALEAEDILIKARNFLVFQGDVESIANQSPKDLTRLVEQIAGSLEYKADYDKLSEESEKAIEDQNFKLNQRRAINAEIKQYSEQKKEADNYQKKADERDDAIVAHVLWKLYHFQKIITESSQEIQRHQDELQEHRRRVEKHEQRLDAARQDQAKTTREVTKAEKNIKAAQKLLEDKQNNLVPVDEKILMSRKNSEKHARRVLEVSKERDSQSRTVDQLNKDLSVVNKAQAKWEENWKKMAKKEGRQLKESDLQEYNRLKGDVNKQTADFQIKIDNLTRQRRTDEQTVANLKSKTEELERHLAALQTQLGDLKERKSSSAADSKQISNEIDHTKKEYNKLVSERKKNAQRHTELDEKLRGVLQRLVEADDGRRQSEKEVRARETVLAMKRIFPGIHGRVHELCKPKQKKYETAVSTVLGRHFDSIVVDSDKIAQDCISYLRDQRLGLATFIPIDTIQIKAVNSSLKAMHKKMRLAIDTVEFDHSVERAISFACGNAMVCDDLDTAKLLCYEKGVEAKAVTLDGTIIHKGGLMTGGRGPNDRNARKWEDKEVENLRVLKDKLMAEISGLPNPRQAATGEESLQSELSGLEQRLAQANEESKALEKNLTSKSNEVDFVQQQLKEVKPKYKDQAEAMEILKKRIHDLQNQISSVEDQVFAAFSQRLGYDNIREYEAQQGSLQQEGAQKKLEFTMQRSKLENQLTFETQRLETTTQRIQKLEEESERARISIESFEAEKNAIQEELDQIGQQIVQLQDVAERERDLQSQKAEKVAEERRELQKRNKEIEFVVKTITGLEAEVQRNASSRYALLRKCKIDEVKIPLENSSAPLDSLPVDDALRDGDEDPDAMEIDQNPDASTLAVAPVRDYGIVLDFSDLDDELKEDSSASQETALQAAISALNTELSTLNPNMRAIDRLNSATERLRASDESFNAARQSAREAKDAFEAVRKQRADLFNKAFNHISNQIGPVYKSLTTSESYPLGGQAYLDTMGADDDTPFLGGLKYHAMPPLKRFRDMDALSGGEKTIAALALLFAIHSYSPSPFFVLDEVDAALDNANIAKVAKYIRNNAGPGMQFIVISLKNGLFQESQTLVGILRDQGANTSRAVTLDLRKYRPT